MHQLRVVIAVAEHSGLLKASEALGVTQPAITKALNELEAELGVKLFHRTNRGAEVTPYGAAMVGYIKAMFSQLEQAAEELAGLRLGVGGRVSVGTLLSASAHLLPDAIVQLHRDRPRVFVSVMEGTYDVLAPALVRGDLDFILGRLPEFQYREGLVLEPLYDEAIAFMVRKKHPLARRTKGRLSDLLEWPWLLPPRETTLRRLLDKAFRDAGLDPPAPSCESMSLLANRRLLQDSDMIGVWPAAVGVEDIRAGRLTALSWPPDLTFGPVGITRHRGRQLSPAAESLIRIVKSVADVAGNVRLAAQRGARRSHS